MLPYPSFSAALEALKGGHKVTRAAWADSGAHLVMLGQSNAPTEMVIWKHTAAGNLVQYGASQADMMTNDWVLVVDSVSP